MRARWVGVCVWLIFSFVAVTASAAPPKRDPALEHTLDAQLAAIEPSLVAKFDAATAELDARDLDGAARDFGAVVAGAPDFSPALRRLCYVEMARGREEDGVADCRKAVAIEPSSDNDAALAIALVHRQHPSQAEEREGLEYARAAVARDPKNVFAQQAHCEAAMTRSEQAELVACSTALLSLAPDDPATHVYAAIAKGSAGDLDAGERELARARDLGLDPVAYQKLRASFEEARPFYVKLFRVVWPVLGVWLGGLALLFAAGMLLSGLTLRTLRVPRPGGAEASAGERALRRAYRSVVTLGALYFYVSVPIVALLVVAIAGGLVVLSFMVGQVPIKLLLIVCVIALYTLVAIARSLLIRVREQEPGLRLDLASEPKLRALLEETARAVETRPVDSVYLVPDAALAVTERGGFFAQVRGKAERALILGVASLDGFELRQLKAVLAHEYGHFQNADTAGGGFALAARRALRLMALHMAMRGVATWYNPAWWFVRGYWAIYLRISQGASRLQEVLADRWAVLSYGSEAFVAGLRHVVSRSIAFDLHADATLREVVEKSRPLANLYQHTTEQPIPDDSVAKALEQAWNRAPSAYDSHPRPADRERWARALAAPGAPASPDDHEIAWSLFSNRDALEKAMTARVRDNVAQNHGVRIAEA